MFKFGYKVFFLTFVGWGVLALFEPSLGTNLLLFVAGLLGAAAILKVLIDVIVHYKECLLEKENERVLPGQSVRIYYDLDEFSKAVQKRGGIR